MYFEPHNRLKTSIVYNSFKITNILFDWYMIRNKPWQSKTCKNNGNRVVIATSIDGSSNLNVT